MLADDALGATRESFGDPLPGFYYDAYEAIDSDPNQELVVADSGGAAVGTLQLTFLPGLSHRGAWRAQIEAVRVDSSMRGSGLGSRLFRWAIERARGRGCRMVQLTSDKSRGDAIRFYRGLGFEATHEGMKLHLP
jgi:GNAT superfamily N-acetyltransferase